MKRYIADTIISFNVRLGDKSKHISFDPTTNGGSCYVADTESLVNALESHPDFNKLFRSEDAPVVHSAPVEVEKTYKEVDVNSLQEAKDYLVDLGISRTVLNSKARIINKAEELGIKFNGI